MFYRLPKPVKVRQPGRPKKYGDRLNIQRLLKEVSILDTPYQVASHVVLTKMCPTQVRLVVVRRRPKRSKPYRYFLVFTTDMTIEIPKILQYYRQRWQIETAFRDAKQHFGFSGYRVKSRKSINRFVQLSFIAASLTKLIFFKAETTQQAIVETVCDISAFIGIIGVNSRTQRRLSTIAYQGVCIFYEPLKIQTHTILPPMFNKIPFL